jgi:hypothetical protein
MPWLSSDPTQTYPTAIPVGHVSHHKGPWVRLLADTPAPAAAILVEASGTELGTYLLDVCYGPPGVTPFTGAHVRVLPDLLLGGRPFQLYPYTFPVPLPAGVDVWACAQVNGSIHQVHATVHLWLPASDTAPYARVTPYGAHPELSRGTPVEPGGTANAYGPWWELDPLTARPIRAVALALGGAGDFTRSACKWRVDVGVGPLGAEVPVLEALSADCNSIADQVMPPVIGPLPVDEIPANSRLVMRAKCSIVTVGDRSFDAIVYGLD